ncbi:MAG: potassium-transporting ATPase KdpC subunit [Frankiales bacterium]|nr:potassium-transporting ATPase KdpC subunit [Frankiales bacterium]
MRATVRQYSAALRLLLVMTVITGVAYPLAVTAVAQIPGLKDRANGSLVYNADGTLIGSTLIGQSFTDKDGNPLRQYFQSRPSAAGAGYDPTASSASNLGPESIVDVLPDPKTKDDSGTQHLLTLVCSRSKAVGELEGVSGARPYCTPSGVGAVLAVFHAGPGYAGTVTRVVSVNQACPATPFLRTYQGVTVACGVFGDDYSRGQLVAIRGSLHGTPAVPADAVTASGSGLDPQISPDYAALQVPRVARARGITDEQVRRLVAKHTTGRGLGFLGEPAVNVLDLDLDLDHRYPYRGH